MLLASNAIDPSTLQAYRLYRISVEFDKKKLEQTFQATAGRVYRARCSIEKSIKRELEKKLSEEVLLPDYEQKAPVVLKLPDQNNIFPEGGPVWPDGQNTVIRPGNSAQYERAGRKRIVCAKQLYRAGSGPDGPEGPPVQQLFGERGL